MGAASSAGAAKQSAGSVAPLSLSQSTAESSVLVVRERPRAAWVIGAAAIGAVVAFGATRLLPSAASSAVPTAEVRAPGAPSSLVTAPVGAGAQVAAAPPPAPTAFIAAPPSPSPSPSPSVAIMRFGDDQGVAIKLAPRPAVAPPPPVGGASSARATAPRPRAGGVGPALPDGSFGLGANDSASFAPSAPSAPPPPEPAKKRPLTPEQQLADAQLKASMR